MDTHCRVEIDTARHQLDQDRLDANKIDHEQEVRRIFEDLCEKSAYMWEAISIDAVPEQHVDAIQEDISEALIDDDDAKLGRIIMSYARAYLLDWAYNKVENRK